MTIETSTAIDMTQTMFVGKSSLTIQFVENQFVDAYDPTIENTFQKQLKHNGTVYDLMIVDTAGQDEYSIFPQVVCIRTLIHWL